MLLALIVEDSKECAYKRVYFSVVYLPNNETLKPSFQILVSSNERFFLFTSDNIIRSAQQVDNSSIQNGIKDFYYFLQIHNNNELIAVG